MIGYGLAFVIGFLCRMLVCIVNGGRVDVFHTGNLWWGGVFVVLNYIATLYKIG